LDQVVPPCVVRCSQIVALTSLVVVPVRQTVPDSVTVDPYTPLLGPVRLTDALTVPAASAGIRTDAGTANPATATSAAAMTRRTGMRRAISASVPSPAVWTDRTGKKTSRECCRIPHTAACETPLGRPTAGQL
jgi:hypothetical protein